MICYSIPFHEILQKSDFYQILSKNSILFLLRMKIGTLLLSLFLSATILFSSVRISLTYAHMYLDPVGFIEKLCENKDKPELECNGKCHLKKVVDEATNNDQAPANTIEYKELLLFVSKRVNYSFLPKVQKNKQIVYYRNLYKSYSGPVVDHPPQA